MPDLAMNRHTLLPFRLVADRAYTPAYRQDRIGNRSVKLLEHMQQMELTPCEPMLLKKRDALGVVFGCADDQRALTIVGCAVLAIVLLAPRIHLLDELLVL